MLRPVWKTCLSLAALTVACWMLSASSAQAGWGHWRYGGCGGCYSPAYVYTTSFCSPCVTGCGATWYNPSWGCYSGWYSGSAWYNPSWGCYSGCYAPWYGGYSIVSGCCDSVVVGAPVEAGAAPTPAPAPPPPAAQPPASEPSSVLPTPPPPGDAVKPTARDRVPANATLFTVVVPEDAQVYVNGLLTKTPGAQRQYISYGLQPGYTYTYIVRAVVTRNGQSLEDVQTVRVSAGTERLVAFDLGGGRPHVAIASRVR
jgi:uncharacterized protein (TIGR03000 family)